MWFGVSGIVIVQIAWSWVICCTPPALSFLSTLSCALAPSIRSIKPERETSSSRRKLRGPHRVLGESLLSSGSGWLLFASVLLCSRKKGKGYFLWHYTCDWFCEEMTTGTWRFLRRKNYPGRLRTNHLQSNILQSFNVYRQYFPILVFCLVFVLYLQCDNHSSELFKQLSLSNSC